MTDTPRTDAAWLNCHPIMHGTEDRPIGFDAAPLADESRTLERELAEARRKNAVLMDELVFLRPNAKEVREHGEICEYAEGLLQALKPFAEAALESRDLWRKDKDVGGEMEELGIPDEADTLVTFTQGQLNAAEKAYEAATTPTNGPTYGGKTTDAEMMLRKIVSWHRHGHAIPEEQWPHIERIASRNASPLRGEPTPVGEGFEKALRFYADQKNWAPVADYSDGYWYMSGRPWMKAFAALKDAGVEVSMIREPLNGERPPADAELLAYINATPVLLSLLYELDLMPEQELTDPEEEMMYTVANHWREHEIARRAEPVHGEVDFKAHAQVFESLLDEAFATVQDENGNRLRQRIWDAVGDFRNALRTPEGGAIGERDAIIEECAQAAWQAQFNGGEEAENVAVALRRLKSKSEGPKA